MIEGLYDELQNAWEAYAATQEESGEPIDKELHADMRRFESRYERAQRGWSLITELGDF